VGWLNEATFAEDSAMKVACRAINRLDSKEFCFELNVPNDARKEIDYIPSREEVDYHNRQMDSVIPEHFLV
jgi:hypothetical protein